MGHLEVAIAELREMKMQPALERACALMERASAPSTRSPAGPEYPDGLSAREVEVLRLLADGKSNQAIADALVISRHTAIRHVSNLFAKIGAGNRAEAAGYAHRHGLV
jgi:DNA-binding NarL/FixJ family response regulator